MADHAEMWFQQDGAPVHYANIVRNRLNENLNGRWIGSIEWPARSPDVTPLDFFLWGYLKHKVYGNRIISVQQLKQLIKDEIELLNLDKTLIKSVCNSVTHCMVDILRIRF